MRAVEPRDDRPDPLDSEVAHGSPEQLVLVGEVEGSREGACQLGDQPHAVPGAADDVEVVRPRPAQKGRPGQVDVPGPRRRTLEEASGVGGDRLAARRVLQIRKGGSPCRWNRRWIEAPGEVAAAVAGVDDPVLPFVVVAEDGRRGRREPSPSAGQRREVDEVRGSLLTCVPEDVGEDESPLRVGVDDLDVVPFIARTMSPGR